MVVVQIASFVWSLYGSSLDTERTNDVVNSAIGKVWIVGIGEGIGEGICEGIGEGIGECIGEGRGEWV